jgi:mannose/fructose/sorbose-specific phosphotransferase system IIA component
MVGCIVLSHGQVAQALLDACKQILGECDNVYALNCKGLNPKGIYDNITHLIESKNLRDGLFILVSLRGGSCWNAACKILKEREKVQLISGLNLSIILSFVTKSKECSFEELGEILVRDGIRGITRLTFGGQN